LAARTIEEIQRIVARIFSAGYVGLGNSKLLGTYSLRQFPTTAHDGELSRERKFGKQLRVL
jgi:hypothetical protein